MKYFSIIFTLIIIFFLNNHVFGQVTNDDKINYQTSINYLKWNDNAWADGNPSLVEPAWLFHYNNTTAYSLTCDRLNYLESSGGQCFRIPQGLDPYYIDPSIYFFALEINKSISDMQYVSFMAWESDDVGGPGTAGCDPGNHGDEINSQHCDNLSFAVKSLGDNPNAWNERNPTLTLPGRSEARFKSTWRYHNGNFRDKPLEFGNIDETSKSHFNSNRASAPLAHSNMGYFDSYTTASTDGQSSPDVYYSFEITGSAQQVVISTDHAAETDFDTYIHLMYFNADQSLVQHIESNDDGGSGRRSLITRDLCVGLYTVVVEGHPSNPTGEFKLSVTATALDNTNINPGTISTSETSFCVGDDLPDIFNVAFPTSTIYVPFDMDPVEKYEWQSKLGEGMTGWTTISGAEDATYLNPDVMVDDPISYRRRALYCGIWTDWSNVIMMTNDGGTIDPGSVELVVGCTFENLSNRVYSFITIPTGSIPGCFGSRQDSVDGNLITYFPTGDPGPITTRWEMSYNDGDWLTVSNGSCCFTPTISTFTNALAGNDGEYRLRRRAVNGCGSAAYSDTITVNTVPRDGSILGMVSSPSGIGGPGAGVPGVTVTAVRTTQVEGGEFTTDTYTAVTNSQGNYTLSDLYYGPGVGGAGFTVTPSRIDTVIRIDSIIVTPPDTIFDTIIIVHAFDPTDYSGADSIILKSTLKSAINIDFTDLTSFTFSGNVHQDFEGTECGLFEVEIVMNGIIKDTTDVFGDYSISIPSIGDYTIHARFKDHTFDTIYNNIYIDRDFYNQDFESSRMHRVYGAFTDGCGGAITGEATLTFSDTINCIVKVKTTIGGQYDFMLPAKKYKISFDHADQTIDLFFAAARLIDLSDADTLLNYAYHAKPVIEIIGLPGASACAAPYDVPILKQAVTYPVSVNVYEGVIGGCPVDTGFVQIIDEISDKGSDTVNIQFGNGVALYKMFPDKPNLTPNHLKDITIAAKDTFNQISNSFQLTALVTGVRAREQQFTTVTPQIPLMILRDPPGDASYSFVTQTQTIETATRFYASDAVSNNVWGEVTLGTQFEAGFIGFDVETEIWGTIGGSLEVGATSTSSNEAVLSITTSETFSTSGNPDVTGAEGDVFVGAAMNMLYATADILTFNENTCKPHLDVDLIMKNDGFKTKFIYTEAYIRNNVIPDLRFLSQFPTHPDSVAFYLDQIKVWEQTLARNEDLKSRAALIENISFSNNAPYDNTTEVQNSESLTLEFMTEINTEVAAEAGIEVAGIGASGGVTGVFKVEMGESNTNATTQALTTGFHLEDDDADGIGDGFTVDILTDPVYKTPVFRLVAGESSCPWEEGTLPRDVPELTVANPIATDVPLGSTAFFNLELKNTSQSMETRTYVLKLKQESNPYGAVITIGGTPAPPGGIGYSIDYLGLQPVTVGVSFGQPGFYAYEALEFELSSPCDPDLNETAIISVFWQSPCSEVGLFEPDPDAANPEDGWRVTAADNEIDIHIKDYDENDLDQIIVQYAAVGGSNWTNLAVIPAANLDPNDAQGTNLGTIVTVNLGNLSDGPYNIRLQLICSGNRLFSRRAIGLIDKEPPKVVGIPSPKDDVYDATMNDEISVNFNELIDCTNAMVTLTRLDNENEVLPLFPLACTDKTVEILPAGALAIPGAFRVSLSGIRDVFGNISPTVNWLFITPGYEVLDSCDPLLLSNNNVNQDAISVAIYQATEISSSGSIQNFGVTTFESQNGVELMENFDTQSGGVLNVIIKMCDDN